jgi:hypothetical protein
MTQEYVRKLLELLQDRDALEEWTYMAHFEAKTPISRIIDSSFEWDKSKQGFSFWFSISNAWEDISNFSEEEIGMTSYQLKKIMGPSKAHRVLKALITTHKISTFSIKEMI